MIKIDELRADLKSISEKLSDLSKTIALSVLALCWVLLLGGKDAPTLPEPVNRPLLLFAIVAALLSLIAGYLQYVFGYACSKSVHDRAEKAGLDETEFDTDSLLYRLRKWFFWAKQFLSGLAVSLLIGAIVMVLA